MFMLSLGVLSSSFACLNPLSLLWLDVALRNWQMRQIMRTAIRGILAGSWGDFGCHTGGARTSGITEFILFSYHETGHHTVLDWTCAKIVLAQGKLNVTFLHDVIKNATVWFLHESDFCFCSKLNHLSGLGCAIRSFLFTNSSSV